MGGRVRLARRGPLLAVADLRLDNRDVLWGELGAAENDLDLLLAAYERWGETLATHLDGPFSYVIWDAREVRASFARDPLGLRPLYHAERMGGVILGSSLPLVQRLVPREVCVEAAADHLTGRLDYPLKTMTVGVERVSAAHWGTVEVDGERATITTQRYWSLDPTATAESISDAEAEAAFQHAFDRSVLARLGETSGALLSGGLDSSSIVVTARALRPEAPLPTFTIVYDDPAADERRYVDAVAASAGVDPLRVQGEGLSLLAELDDDLRAVGEPFFTPNLFLARALYAEAGARGLDSVLDGFAGDNVVGHGDLWLTELAWSFRWPSFVRELRAAARRSRRPRWTTLRMLRDYALRPLARPFRRPEEAPHFMRPERMPPRRARDPWHVRDRARHHAELSGPLLPRAFEATYTRASALGVEPRFPFADRALVELCLSLPSRQRVRDGLTRSILRRAMGERLPAILRSRAGKARIDGNFERALFERDWERLRDLVETDVPGAAEYLDVEAVREAYRQALTSVEERSRLALPLWRAVTFARWLSLSAETRA